MRSHYALSIMSYVIERREEKIRWKTIRQEIKDKFGVDPPTIRAMQKWIKSGLTREQIDKMLEDEVRKKLPDAAAFTQAYFSEVMLPNIWRSLALGADLEKTMWMMFLSSMEAATGKDKFERIFNEYMERRAEVIGQVETTEFFSSAFGKLKKEKKEEEVKADEGEHQAKE